MEDEMFAQILETLSVVAAGRKLKEPFKVPRPDWMGAGAETVVQERKAPRAKAYTPKADPMAARTAPRVAGRRRTGPDPSYGRALGLMQATAHQRRRA